MSIETALQFIQYLHDNDDLKSQCLSACEDVSLGQLVLVAAQSGFICSETDLVEAHKHDWAIRWWEFSRKQAQIY